MTSTTLLTSMIIAASCCSVAAASNDIPPHPDAITFEPLAFEPPSPDAFRRTLSNGVTVYLAPNRELPLVNMVFTFRGGQYLDPTDQIGLAIATGSLMRQGGTVSLAPAQVDEEFDGLAAIANVVVSQTSSRATLNCLSSTLDQSLPLMIELLRHPAFDQQRLDVWKDNMLERIRQRNDDAGSMLDREWAMLMYGSDHVEAAEMTAASIESITREHLRAMHERIFHPAAGNLIIAVSGDFNPANMLARLEHAFSGWKPGAMPPDPAPQTMAWEPGVYHVEKDIPQGKVIIGMRSIRRDDPDIHAAMLMNDILGGGGFTSRLTRRIRNDEGLAYAAGSMLTTPVWYPGEWRASFQSKNETVALGISIVLEEIRRLRETEVSQDELATAKRSFIETFPRRFENPAATLDVFVNDEMTARQADYWKNFRRNIEAVTAADIQRVASTHLHPDRMAIMIVGKWSEIAPGDPGGRASMKSIFDGRVTHLPVRDPLTLEPIAR